MARILITGCSSGIGRATAIRLAAAGHEVIATARSRQALDGLELGARLALDVTHEDSIAAAIAEAGEIDVLVNNAGISIWSPAELCPPDAAERLMETNLMGVIRMTRAVLPQMRRRRSGRIIQISSTAARRPSPLLGLYAASKAAIEAYSFALRLEVRDFGIWVSVVGMGAIESKIGDNRLTVPDAGTDYAGIAEQTRRRIDRIRVAPLSAGLVADRIAELVGMEEPPFRDYVGEATSRAVAEIAAMSDAELERRMLAELRGA